MQVPLNYSILRYKYILMYSLSARALARAHCMNQGGASLPSPHRLPPPAHQQASAATENSAATPKAWQDRRAVWGASISTRMADAMHVAKSVVNMVRYSGFQLDYQRLRGDGNRPTEEPVLRRTARRPLLLEADAVTQEEEEQLRRAQTYVVDDRWDKRHRRRSCSQ